MQHHQQPLGLIMQQQSPTFPHQQQQRQSHHVHKKQAKGSMNVPTHFPQSFATEVKDDFDMFSCGAESHNSRPIMVRRESLASMTHSILSPLSPELQISNMADMTTGQPHGMQQDRNREKNRLAASKCREKSKKFVDELRERERDLTNQRAKLTACAAALKDEVLMLKHEIFRHGNCKCDFIQNYLNNAAKQIT
ncbi:hypothetical protein BJ170DRAFT_455655 [Xylariales sp. AK1849]|nr:hypothetical protein BJ170DRAFT_455655 [Xylariales sp. AK1849]